MRVTHHMLYESTYRDLDRNIRRLIDLQKHAASAKRVLRPSDDPLAAQRILEVKSDLRRIDPSLRNGQYVTSWLSVTESALQQMEDALVRAKELAISQGTGTANPDTRDMTAKEIQQIYDLIVQLANTRLGDRYVFGGTLTQTPPVERDDDYNPTFQANDQEIEVRINGEQTLTLNLPAGDVLGRENNGILATLADLIDALENDRPDDIRAALDGLDQGMQIIQNSLAKVGSRANALEGHGEDLQDRQLVLEETLSVYEDADMARVVTDMVNQQTIYEAALRTTAMITRVSLMNFIG